MCHIYQDENRQKWMHEDDHQINSSKQICSHVPSSPDRGCQVESHEYEKNQILSPISSWPLSGRLLTPMIPFQHGRTRKKARSRSRNTVRRGILLRRQ